MTSLGLSHEVFPWNHATPDHSVPRTTKFLITAVGRIAIPTGSNHRYSKLTLIKSREVLRNDRVVLAILGILGNFREV